MKIKERLKRIKQLNHIYLKVQNYLIGGNKYCIANNKMVLHNASLKHTIVKMVGNNNILEVLPDVHLNNCNVIIYGSNNCIRLEEKVILNQVKLYIEDDQNSITIGRGTTIECNSEIATIEGTSVSIGEDCMISSDVRVCTGDSHSLINQEGKRVNYSRNVIIGDHVWIGMRAVINKGAEIADNCIVGACSLLAGKLYTEKDTLIAGVPAKVIKRGIGWRRERL